MYISLSISQNASVCRELVNTLARMQTHDETHLVADERLVVRLCVRDALLEVAAVRESVADVAQVPVLVLRLLEQLDPHV